MAIRYIYSLHVWVTHEDVALFKYFGDGFYADISRNANHMGECVKLYNIF